MRTQHITTADDFHVGQEVVVHAPRMGRHRDGGRYSGRITKIARKYLTIEFSRGGSAAVREMRFSIATRREHRQGDYQNYLWWFETPESQAAADRWERARKVWNDHRLRFDSASPRTLTIEEMEAIAQILDPTFVPGPVDPPVD